PLHSIVRTIDTVARVGGDEFVMIISPAPTRQHAEEVGRRVNESLQMPMRLAQATLHISASIGVAFYPADGTTAETIIGRADAAMYCAKHYGRNNLQYFSHHMNSATIERVSLASDLHQALSLQ